MKGSAREGALTHTLNSHMQMKMRSVNERIYPCRDKNGAEYTTSRLDARYTTCLHSVCTLCAEHVHLRVYCLLL